MNSNQPKQTTTKNRSKLSKEEIKLLMEQDSGFLKPVVQFVVQEVLEAEMSEAVGGREGRAHRGYETEIALRQSGAATPSGYNSSETDLR